MKKSIITILVSMSALAISSFGLKSLSDRNAVDAREQFAISVVAALRESSTEKYVSLFPALSDFKKVMNRHASFYGESLIEAQKDFEKEYKQKLVPQGKAAFETVISEGKKKGIKWSQVSLVNTEVSEGQSEEWGATAVILSLKSEGKIFQIRIEKALRIEGQWKASQYITLF